MLHKNIKINKQGHLCFAGVDTVELAKKHGTPLIVLDEQGIRKNCREYISAVRKHLGAKSFVAYASKALSFVGLNKILSEENMRLDVASIGELYTAVASGFDMSKVYFHSNIKTESDVRFALQHGIGYLMVDNFEELDLINALAGDAEKRQKIFLRVSPGVTGKTVKAVQTGATDSKFGVPIATGQAMEFVKKALEIKNIDVCGIHCHIGSQIFETEPFILTAETMLRFMADVKSKTGFKMPQLILGGGFGVRYIEEHPQINISEKIEKVGAHLKSVASELGMAMPAIGLEPGRSIVASNGMTLYTVGSVKEIPGIKNYIVTDGSMNDNPRYALYKSPYTLFLANKANDESNFIATVAGRTCESGDIIQENVSMPKPAYGDTIAVAVTGAYTFAMASNYNRLPRPAIIIIDKDGNDRVGVKRESLEDLIKNDIK